MARRRPRIRWPDRHRRAALRRVGGGRGDRGQLRAGLPGPIACSIGGDAFALLWDPKAQAVVGLNGSGRSPAAEPGDASRAKDGLIHSHGVASVSARARWTAGGCHQRYDEAEMGRAVRTHHRAGRSRDTGRPDGGLPLATSKRNFTSGRLAIEETDNFLKVWAPEGRTPAEGEIFANPRARPHPAALEGARGSARARSPRPSTATSRASAGSPRPTWRIAASG